MARRVRARQKGVKGYVNAMRPFDWGNPFKYAETLEESLKMYEKYLRYRLAISEDRNKDFHKRFDALHDRDIGCTCPEDRPCHVDIIIKVLNERKKT